MPGFGRCEGEAIVHIVLLSEVAECVTGKMNCLMGFRCLAIGPQCPRSSQVENISRSIPLLEKFTTEVNKYLLINGHIWGLESSVRGVLLCNDHEYLNLIPKTHVKHPDVVIYICNPRPGETVIGGSLGLTGKST